MPLQRRLCRYDGTLLLLGNEPVGSARWRTTIPLVFATGYDSALTANNASRNEACLRRSCVVGVPAAAITCGGAPWWIQTLSHEELDRSVSSSAEDLALCMERCRRVSWRVDGSMPGPFSKSVPSASAYGGLPGLQLDGETVSMLVRQVSVGLELDFFGCFESDHCKDNVCRGRFRLL